ncbi:tRNA lysidine(34) synthetase TilS [Mesopusillimonas faecipullorum]|uniref:tRNA lysidine(34) synthetase TilS n=1 Tax=Mesopusillimonas faecipullorum TaxID=2755040 RepID=UPI001D020B54|nr:tRNA lysidine(34) synthetase TilS [Mesopusillimonas faecipullorum]
MNGSDLDPQLAAALAPAMRWLPHCRRLGVALSGGADSAMLAVHAAAYAQRHGLDLHCLHVHHGLQEAAGRWRDRARDLAQRLGAGWQETQVTVDFSHGDGIESAARTARYKALIEMSRGLGLDGVLLAHHQDDQAETVLMRLLRGAGPEGLAAMRAISEREGMPFLRPWLGVPRKLILACAQRYVQQHGWEAVQDPTNIQEDYTRGALRGRLTPHLDERWPGWQAILARHARQSAELADLLTEVAAQDFAGLQPSEDRLSFSLADWRALSPPRQAQVLRHWLAQAGLRMPSDARLRELMRQMRQLHALGHDRSLQLKHDGWVIACVKGRMLLVSSNTLQ